jgi:hypothetical protein
MKRFTLIMILALVTVTWGFSQSNHSTIAHPKQIKSVSTTFTEFTDNFESGTGKWTLTNSWGLSTVKANSPTHSISESPTGNYTNNQTSFCTMTDGIDLSSKMSAELSFWAQFKIEAGFDYMYVDVSNDDFSTYTNIDIFDGEVTTWTQYTYSLGGFVGPGFTNVKIRFRLISDQGFVMDGWYADDILITSSDEDLSPPLILSTPPEFYEGALGEFVAEADIIDISGLSNVECMYSVDGVPQATGIPGVNTGGNHYTFTIPAQSAGSNIEYQIMATDASSSSNVSTTDPAYYIAGEYYKYDNGVVDFFVSFFTNEGAAVVFSLDGPTHIATALIRNYMDVEHYNTDMLFHIWAPNSSQTGPGADLITPFLVTPEANVNNTSPMTRIDLRDYMSTGLNNLSGDVFVGFTVPGDTVNITETDGGAAGRTFVFDGTTWGTAAADFHFRLITTGSGVGTPELMKNEISVAPNPMTHYTYVTTTEALKQPRIELFSLDGRKINVRQIVNGNKIQLTRDQIGAGLYLLRVFDGNSMISQEKLIVR